MRLKQIKLAGFKSFVDPTTVPFPAQMTAIVGPNGCGKSNIIDAVRWVLGESSAKNLRGDAMTDVIFNGATSRKPVSLASIELVFENAQGRLTGSLADRNEISIKRQVNRDSQSFYFLNGSKCRRRDITDIFLGTGLGPRSYAIIEQGMISRLIESRPMELRVFLEEAAGISKYKERRRETENRIRHTRENLDRLDDVREELASQLEKLKRQATAARRYKELKALERKLRAELYALRWYRFSQQMADKAQELKQQESELEAFQAQQSSGNLGIVQLKTEQDQVKSQHAQVQQQFYRLGNDITRLEQVILHRKQTFQVKTNELRKLRDDVHDLRSHHQLETERCHELEIELDELQPELEILQEQKLDLQEQVERAEDALQQWQQQWHQHSQLHHQLAQQVQIMQTRLNGLASNLSKSRQQAELAQEQLAELQHDDDTEALQQQTQALRVVDEQIEKIERQLQEQTKQLQQQSDAIEAKQLALARTQEKRSALLGEQQSLSHLIEQQSQSSTNDLIFPQPVSTLQQQLEVESGWELAVHKVLHSWLDYVVTCDDVELAKKHAVNMLVSQQGDDSWQSGRAGTLAAKVKAPSFIIDLLEQITLAASRDEVIQRRLEFTQGRSIMSADGCWSALEFVSTAEHAEGVNILLLRTQVEQLQSQLFALEQTIDEQQGVVATEKDRISHSRVQIEENETQLQDLRRQRQELNTQVNMLIQEQQRAQSKQQVLTEHVERLQRQIDDDEQEQVMLEDELLIAQEQLAEHQLNEEQDMSSKEPLQRALQSLRQQLEGINNQGHQRALQVEGLKAQHLSVKDGLQRSQHQLNMVIEREQQLHEELDSDELPVEEQVAELELLIEARTEVEAEQHQLADTLADIEQKIRDIEQGQQGVLDRIGQMRATMESTRLELESFKIRANSVLDQFNELGQPIKEVLDRLDIDADDGDYQKELERTTAAISRLGAINLAAIEEYDVQAERKGYLDSQHQDLTSAMDTLEEAIRKIDRETRARFKETFEQVNSDFQHLFPKVFGGGMAYLALTDDDLLETGVSIMARPPGKKNSTIHLLSGGEKALTALSLVFAIFRLNPAPFCMLDEVDAPLDDVNVGRFCNLVKEMSSTVQFIYISHNKVAMEMASTLTGVTMQEPGVSRMVAVDVDEALSFAAAS